MYHKQGKKKLAVVDKKKESRKTGDDVRLQVQVGHTRVIKAVSWSPDGKTLASGSEDKTICLWSYDGRLMKTIEVKAGSADCVAFSPDGNAIALVSSNEIKLWSREGEHLRTLTGHTRGVESVAFSPRSTIIASASDDTTIRLWDAETGSDLKIIGYKVFVNGVPVHGLYIKRFKKSVRVQSVGEHLTLSSVPDIGSNPGDNKIEMSGFTEDGIESKRETVYLRYQGADLIKKSNLYIVAIGINDYGQAKGFDSLKYAVGDARDIAGRDFIVVGK